MSRSRGWITLLSGVLLMVVAPPMVYSVGQKKGEAAKALRREGKPTEADVVSVRQSIRRSDRITYAFNVDGRSFSNTEDAERTMTDRYANGGKLKVIFLPRDPSVSTYDLARLENAARSSTSWGPWLAGGIGVVLIGVGIVRLRER